MATSSKPAFDGQSLEEFFASFAYKGGGGGHDDGIRKRNSSGGGGGGGGGGRVDKRVGQGWRLLSPNNSSSNNSNNNNTPPPPPPLPSSSLQSTTNRKKTTMTRPASILNGLSPAEFIASFAYKGRRVDDRIGKGEDLLSPGTPPPPPSLRNRKRKMTAASTTTVRRVTRFFPCPAERFVVVDVKKDITGKAKASSSGAATRKRPRTTGNKGRTDANRQPQKRSKGRRKRRSIQLSAEEKYSDAYRRVSDHDMWDAPRSSHNLLQERHCFDPWRVLVICILLNVTTGDQVRKVLPGFFLLFPDAKSVNKKLKEQIADKLRSLGLQWKRAQLIIDLSERYLEGDWTHVTQLPGIGKYAADAYAIFAAGKLEQVKPQDHKLVEYWKEVGEMLCRKS
ncbi:uncharacterized protein LOC120105929 [Phoenix dactylifera]|uniref:Uncharacterized protein LOC120105929 n=1 Tax=Phoenix dactylifera TaxID=42345 RepID=A0A8B8ZSZ8_PHODC|nr:uncharacterized protein LOC120105929 [Phoenix dactylifera]